MSPMKKPSISQLVQALIDAAINEGVHEARGTYQMKGAYERTHAARDKLMDAIDKLSARRTETTKPKRSDK